MTGAGARGVGSESGIFVFVNKALICQKPIDLPKDFETRVRGEEKIRVGGGMAGSQVQIGEGIGHGVQNIQ